VSWDKIAEHFIQVYFTEMDALNVQRATFYPKATEHMDEMISLSKALLERGLAYQAEGDVYFEVRKFAKYGALSGRNIDDLRAGARVEISERKHDPLDFTIWKAAKENEPSWESPWGPGRPGWNLECSAMALKYLGKSFDIHGGGQDLIFPHHENEIAQSEGAMDDDAIFARYWLHNGFVTINKEKMSKSLGNFFQVSDVLKRYSPQVLRYFLTSAHYRSPIDYSDQTLDQAKSAYERLRLGIFNMARVLAGQVAAGAERPQQSANLHALLATAEIDFRQAMDDDFNTPQALAVLFDLVGEANRLLGAPGFVLDPLAHRALSDARALTLRLSTALGIELNPEPAAQDNLTPRLMHLLIDLRARARKEKNFALSDAIRDQLNDIGITLEDTPQGTVWRKSSE
jgi:cysteinyl-tRNA synthetase